MDNKEFRTIRKTVLEDISKNYYLNEWIRFTGIRDINAMPQPIKKIYYEFIGFLYLYERDSDVPYTDRQQKERIRELKWLRIKWKWVVYQLVLQKKRDVIYLIYAYVKEGKQFPSIIIKICRERRC